MSSISWVGRLMVDAHIPLPAGLVSADEFGQLLNMNAHVIQPFGIDRFANTI